jgi:hypothetical protein
MNTYHLKKLFLILFLTSLSGVTFANSAAPIGHILAFSGQSHVFRKDEKLSVKAGFRLFKSDRLITGNDSRLRFRLVDGSEVTLGENSKFNLITYEFNPKKHSNNKAEFKLSQGVFRFISGLITQRDNPDLKVITPVATIGVRGTDFWGGYLDPDAVDVLLISSEHKLIVSNKYGSITLDKNGLGTTIRSNIAPTEPKTWPESKVNRALATVLVNE